MALRLISACILIPVTLLFTWHGQLAFMAIVFAVGARVYFEWMRMVGAGADVALRWLGWGALLAVAGATLASPLPIATGTVLIAAAAAALFAFAKARALPARWVASGLLYAGAAIVALLALRRGEAGFGAVIFIFLVAWGTDTFAFFAGRTIGGPRLWRAVSPSKTWAGAVGGLLGGIVFGVIVTAWLGLGVGIVTCLVAAGVAVAAMAGDLLESAAKRRFNVKDAGHLIPGHGGVMDRVDGLVTASLAAVVFGHLMPGETAAAGLFALLGA